jgi:glycerophosphoryl diester phosphodiesterase
MSNHQADQIFPGVKGPLLFGHRGFSCRAPENTLAAFRLLLDNNIPGVELDIHLCATGELVVVHDNNLVRLTGFNGFVEQTGYSVIKQLSVDNASALGGPGSKEKKDFTRERIPLLSEVFDLLGDRVYYDIELKTEQIKCGELEKNTLQMIYDYGLQDRVLISSFNPFSLKALKTLGWKRAALIFSRSQKVPFYLRRGEGQVIAGCPVIKPQWEILVRRQFYFQRKKKSLPLLPWTVDDPTIGKQLIQSGAAGIISNNPAMHTYLLH